MCWGLERVGFVDAWRCVAGLRERRGTGKNRRWCICSGGLRGRGRYGGRGWGRGWIRGAGRRRGEYRGI